MSTLINFVFSVFCQRAGLGESLLPAAPIFVAPHFICCNLCWWLAFILLLFCPTSSLPLFPKQSHSRRFMSQDV